jgi:uncharacterized protein YqjF (DUF2071 family)
VGRVTTGAPFLTAAWRYLAMLNFEVDPELLAGRVPRGTELETWHGHALVSVVGFRFADVRVRGLAIPGHRDFDEVNLRFYVRRPMANGEWRRGVVFIKEIVPLRLVAAVARWWYGEPYIRLPMRHDVDAKAIAVAGAFRVRYEWKHRGRWHAIVGMGDGEPAVFAPGSEAEFITEHYWGYTHLPGGRTNEYRVDHPPWRVWPLREARLEGDVRPLYGPGLADALRAAPRSAFLAEGSAVSVSPGQEVGIGDEGGSAA